MVARPFKMIRMPFLSWNNIWIQKNLAFWYSKLCFVIFSTALFFVFEKSNTLKLQGVPREMKKSQQWQQRQRWMASGLIFFFSSFSLPLGPRLLVECQACRWELSLYWLSTSLGSPPSQTSQIPSCPPPHHLRTNITSILTSGATKSASGLQSQRASGIHGKVLDSKLQLLEKYCNMHFKFL